MCAHSGRQRLQLSNHETNQVIPADSNSCKNSTVLLGVVQLTAVLMIFNNLSIMSSHEISRYRYSLPLLELERIIVESV